MFANIMHVDQQLHIYFQKFEFLIKKLTKMNLLHFKNDIPKLFIDICPSSTVNFDSLNKVVFIFHFAFVRYFYYSTGIPGNEVTIIICMVVYNI